VTPTAMVSAFLDSSALCSAMISPNEGAWVQRILTLGEKGVIDLRISGEVLGDVERFVRQLNPAMLPKIAQIIALGNIEVTLPPDPSTTALCNELIGYLPDARILASAVECGADVLVTYDSEHLRGNPKIKPPAVSVLVMNPKEFLDWAYVQWRNGR
jgi:predicted nucleic acid-binding protein